MSQMLMDFIPWQITKFSIIYSPLEIPAEVTIPLCLSEVRPHPLEVSSKQTKGEERELLSSFADETEKNY